MLKKNKLDTSYDIVYCLDKKFNKQAFISIASFYKTNSDFNNKIFIIHKSPKSFMKFIRKIEKLFPGSNITLIKFKFNIKRYPNLVKSHVSEATYYRMFIGDHIKTSSNFLVYIDADAFFLSDVNSEILKIVNILDSKNLLLSAKTEHMFSEAPELFYRLNMKRNYFNAGVMIINYKKWKVENVSEGLRNKVIEIYDKINYWDQDVLNSHIDGKFQELPSELNYIIDSNNNEINIPSNVKIVHYAGKNKPWNKKGGSLAQKSYYQELEKYVLTK